MTGISNVTLHTHKAAGRETDAPLCDPAMHHTEEQTPVLLNFVPHLSTTMETKVQKTQTTCPSQ